MCFSLETNQLRKCQASFRFKILNAVSVSADIVMIYRVISCFLLATMCVFPILMMNSSTTGEGSRGLCEINHIHPL